MRESVLRTPHHRLPLLGPLLGAGLLLAAGCRTCFAQSASLQLTLGAAVVIPIPNYHNHALDRASAEIIRAERVDGGVKVTGLAVGQATLHVFDDQWRRTDYQVVVKPVSGAPSPASMGKEASKSAPATSSPAPETPTKTASPKSAPSAAEVVPPLSQSSLSSSPATSRPSAATRRGAGRANISGAKNLAAVINRPGVHVQVRNGVIVLTGTVASETERERAQRLAELLATRRVLNQLQIGEAQPAGGGGAVVGGAAAPLNPRLTSALQGAPGTGVITKLIIPVGRSQILNTPENILKVIVADGEVVSADAISARQALFIGQKPGVTDAYLLVEQYPHDPLGATQHYEITVPEPAPKGPVTKPSEPGLNADELRFRIEDALADWPNITVSVLLPLWKTTGGGVPVAPTQPPASAAQAGGQPAVSGGAPPQPTQPVVTGNEPFTIILRGKVPTETDIQRAGEIAGAFGGLVLNYLEPEHVTERPKEPTLEEKRAAASLKLRELVETHLKVTTIDPVVSDKGVVLLGTVPSQRLADRAAEIVSALADWQTIQPLITPPGEQGTAAAPAPAPEQPGNVTIVNPNIEGYGQGGRRRSTGGVGGGTTSTARNLQLPGIVNLLEVVGKVQQVLTRVKIVEIDRNALNTLGIDWGSYDPSLSGAATTGGTTGTGGLTAPRIGSVAFGEQSVPGSPMKRLTSLMATLDMLEQSGKAHTLASPDLMAIEGTKADLVVGGEFPIPATTFSGGGGGGGTVGGGAGTTGIGGGFLTQSVEFRSYGIILSVLPEATEGGHVLMQLHVESSSLDFANALTINGTPVPAFKTRQVSDAISVKDGDTVVIAGLISKEEQQQIERVPFLSKIPLLGQLFTKRSFKNGETELVIFLTPHIVEEPATAETLQRAEDLRSAPPLQAPNVSSATTGFSGGGGATR